MSLDLNPCLSDCILFFKKIFLYLAAPGLPWGRWDLVPWPGIKSRPPALEAGSLSHWPPWPLNPTNCKLCRVLWLYGSDFSSQARSDLGGSMGQRLNSLPLERTHPSLNPTSSGLLAVWPWLNYLASLCLGVSICRLEWSQYLPVVWRKRGVKYSEALCTVPGTWLRLSML